MAAHSHRRDREPDGLDPATPPEDVPGFEAIVAGLDPPVYVVTAAADDERGGCLVGFACQCSIDPVRFAVWLSKKNRTYRIARRAEVLAVHVLREDDEDLAELFGGETGDEVDKLARCSWRPGPEGVPILRDVDHFVGVVRDRFDAGDHVGFVLDVTSGRSRRGDLPALSFQQVRHIEAGHAP